MRPCSMTLQRLVLFATIYVSPLVSLLAHAMCTRHPFKVVENCLRSKKGASLDDCEDTWAADTHHKQLVSVIDGATSPTGRRWTTKQLKGGQWAAVVLKEGITEMGGSKDPPQSPREIVDFLTRKLHAAYRSESRECLELMTKHPEERATASFVLYCHIPRQIIIVGDCQFALLDATGSIRTRVQPERFVDQVTSQARCMFLEAERLAGVDMNRLDIDPGRELIQPLLIRQRLFQNNPNAPQPYRYYALDGFHIPDEGIEVHDVPEDIAEIILASDGYTKLFSTLEETESYHRKLLEEDPLMMGDRCASTKGVRPGNESFDDRTYLRIRIN